MRRRWLAWRATARERGAAAIVMVLIIAGVIIPLGAYAVDLGVQRVSRSDAQSVADVVALDMARALGSNQPVNNTVAAADAARTKGAVGATGVTVVTGYVDPKAAFISDQGLGCRSGPPYNAYFAQVPSGKSANAVLAIARGSVGFHFTSGSGSVCRSAIATAESQTCFTVGSYVAGLKNAPGTLLGFLNPILGVDTTLVGYQGLANANIDLLSLSNALVGLGYPDGVLATNVRLADLLKAEAGVLAGPPNNDTVDANLLTQIANVTALANLPINLTSQLLSLGTQGSGGQVAGTVNVFDLLAGAVAISNGQNFVSAQLNKISVPGLANLAVSANLIDGKHQACGVAGAQASSSQLNATVTGTVLGASGVDIGLSALSSIISNPPNIHINQIPLSLALNTGQATGTLGAVTCNPDDIPITARTLLAYLGLTGSITGGGSITLGTNLLQNVLGLNLAQLLGLLGVGGANVTATININVPLADVGVNYPVDANGQLLEWKMGQGTPPDTYDTTKKTGPDPATLPHLANLNNLSDDISVTIGGNVGSFSLSQITSLTSTLTSAVVTLVSNLVTQTVSPLVNGLVDALNPALQSLQQMLGLTVPGAVVGVLPTAKCASPTLR